MSECFWSEVRFTVNKNKCNLIIREVDSSHTVINQDAFIKRFFIIRRPIFRDSITVYSKIGMGHTRFRVKKVVDDKYEIDLDSLWKYGTSSKETVV